MVGNVGENDDEADGGYDVGNTGVCGVGDGSLEKKKVSIR